MEKFLIFTIDNTKYAFNIENIIKIVQNKRQDQFIDNLIEDEIVPVLNLKEIFKIPDSKNSKEEKIIFVQNKIGEKLGFIVDKVNDIIETDYLNEFPELDDLSSELFFGVIPEKNNHILVLNIEKLFEFIKKNM